MKNKASFSLLSIIFITSNLSAQIIRHAPGTGRVPINAVTTMQLPPPAANNNAAATTPVTTSTPPETPAQTTPTTATTGQDKDDMIEIQGVGGTAFTAYNNYDGSPASYNQMIQISVTLIPALGGSYSFAIIFYSPTVNISEAAFYDQGSLNIFYPLSMYNDIKAKISETLNDKKKIYVRVIQKVNGYREGSLIF
jgi:hypothetical protein